MERRRILIVDNGLLAYAGLEALLSANERMELLRTPDSDHRAMLQAIAELQPDVLILDEVSLFENLESTLRSLKRFPKLRTVIVNWDKNEIRVCDQKHVHIAEIGDFYKVL